jgi:hypothetical protein
LKTKTETSIPFPAAAQLASNVNPPKPQLKIIVADQDTYYVHSYGVRSGNPAYYRVLSMPSILRIGEAKNDEEKAPSKDDIGRGANPGICIITTCSSNII